MDQDLIKAKVKFIGLVHLAVSLGVVQKRSKTSDLMVSYMIEMKEIQSSDKLSGEPDKTKINLLELIKMAMAEIEEKEGGTINVNTRIN